MLYDLFFALLEAFKWIIIGTSLMCVLFFVFVVLPAMVANRRPARHKRRKDQIRFNKELEAQYATFYNNDANDYFDNKFFERVQEHVFGNIIEEPFQDQSQEFPHHDTSIDAVLRSEAQRFLSGEHPMLQDQPPRKFEEFIGGEILWDLQDYKGMDQPRMLRDKSTTFLKNTDGVTDGFQQLP